MPASTGLCETRMCSGIPTLLGNRYYHLFGQPGLALWPALRLECRSISKGDRELTVEVKNASTEK
jgi:hypothetical protein